MYHVAMATSGTTSFRTDPALEAAIAALMAADEEAKSRSEVIRQAIFDAARTARREALRREAERMMADPSIVAETLAVAAELAEHRAW